MDMATGKITKWHVKDGDTVKKGAPLFEIETDKAAMEVEAPGDGIIRNIIGAEGAVVPVGQAVAFIYAGAKPLRTARCRNPYAPVKPMHRHLVQMRNQRLCSLRHPHLDGVAPRHLPGGWPARRLTLDVIAGSGPRGRIVAR